ncbi:MAG TPA: Coenzyme F420 hydrogenase/dehydrogenase, beta subunit C-terminal domain [Methanospirillum sp.]|nr:Coenzyme F420 hydrogenase/dehydrogenase, beta subunit C-terminal domain [Methanospirillum sp.]
MIRTGELLYAWAEDPAIRSCGECGGVVTGLLTYLLEKGAVDAVSVTRQGADIYDAGLAIITDPSELLESAGSLICGTHLSAKLLVRYLQDNAGLRMAIVVKGCEAKAIYELAKRNRVNLEDHLLIGLNCSGTISPADAAKMIQDMFGMIPDQVTRITFSQGRCIVSTPDKTAAVPIDELESAGYGRRLCCQRCQTRIPRQCDIVCGTWGVVGEDTNQVTCVEICSTKGAEMVQDAILAGCLASVPADPKGKEARSRVEDAMILISQKNRDLQFGEVGSGNNILDLMMKETSRCIKCYQCTEACPLCICEDCRIKKPWLVKPGQVPPPFMFHLIRLSHVADSCVNCGQCEDRCPMEIRNSLFMNALQYELELMFGYHAGEKAGSPVLAKVNELEEWEHNYGDNYEERSEVFRKTAMR